MFSGVSGSALNGAHPVALAVPQRQVRAADRANEDLGAPVLVEEHHLDVMLLQLRQHEIQRDGLARAGGPADEGVAEVAVVEVEVVRRARGCLEQADRWTPMVPVRAWPCG